jgi:hypothetical protein
MKNLILALLLCFVVFCQSNVHAGTWAKSSGSGSGSNPSCYLVIFNTASYGTNQLIGTGVVSANTFSGFLKFTANPEYSATTRLITCGTSGDCAWSSGSSSSGGGVVTVSGLPIVSAQAIACY